MPDVVDESGQAEETAPVCTEGVAHASVTVDCIAKPLDLVDGPKAVLQARVPGTRVDPVNDPKLADPA